MPKDLVAAAGGHQFGGHTKTALQDLREDRPGDQIAREIFVPRYQGTMLFK